MVFNLTIPRRPVSAMFTGPGPSYSAPGLLGQTGHDPRSSYARAPAYHIGLRHPERSDAHCGPGPCYLPEPKVYRNGREVTPQCHIINRRPEVSGIVTPGPAAYEVRCDMISSYSRPPAYSIPRAKSYSKDSKRKTPGPNAYDPDLMIGRTVRSTKRTAPGYTIRSRSAHGGFNEDRAKTPGPGAYAPTCTDIIKTKAPGYTMVGRNLMPADKTKKPGPGAHCPERVMDARCRSSPAFSFGIRHSPFAFNGLRTEFIDDY